MISLQGPTTTMISNDDIITRTDHNNDIKENTTMTSENLQSNDDINNDITGRLMLSTKTE